VLRNDADFVMLGSQSIGAVNHHSRDLGAGRSLSFSIKEEQMRIQPASNQQVQVERKPPTAAKGAPAAAQPAATVNISQAALHAVASKADADGDGDGR
jgi:hypothetical protein